VVVAPAFIVCETVEPSGQCEGFTSFTPLEFKITHLQFHLFVTSAAKVDLCAIARLHSALEVIDLGGLAGVLSIGNSVLCDLPNLRHVYASCPTDFQRIGHSFCKGCPQLKQVDLRGFGQVVSIGSNFLVQSGVEVFSTSGLSALQRIGKGFLMSCWSLRCVDLCEGLANVQHIDDFFLAGCGLSSFDFVDMASLRSIGDGCLSKTAQLVDVRLMNLPQLASIGKGLLQDSGALQRVRMANLPQLETIGDSFAAATPRLFSCEVTNCPSLRTIGERFLNGSGLTAFAPSGLAAVTTIGSNWMSDCHHLRSFTGAVLPSLRHISSYFLSGCNGLRYFDSSGLGSVGGIDQCFLADCHALREDNIDFAGFTAVRKVDFRAFIRSHELPAKARQRLGKALQQLVHASNEKGTQR